MQRLVKTNKNSAKEYDRIFKERAKKDPDWQDVRRWKTLLKYYKNDYLLEIGCLDSMIPTMIKFPHRYLGVDVAIESLKSMSATHYPAQYMYANAYDLKIDAKFDYIVMGEILEHLETPKKAIKEAFKVLDSSGCLALSVPLEEAREPGACDLDRHLWSYTKDDIVNMVKPYSNKIKTKVLRSQYFPKYRYCWPQLLVWAWKK